MGKPFYVYILSSGTLYTGVTSNISKRIGIHKTNEMDGFTKKYGVHNLVYAEEYPDADSALTREKQIKKWRRAWKIRLIEEHNPDWNDLYSEFGL